MSTQRQFDLCMGPDTKETDCTQNTLHFYVKFIRRDKHITSIKNLRPKVACSLTRGLQWNSMHSQIWMEWRQYSMGWSWTTFRFSELEWGELSIFPSLLFQSKEWTVSKIRKLCSSKSNLENFSTDKKARQFESMSPKARVGQISPRGFSDRMGKSSYWWYFSSYWWYFSLTFLFFRELVFRLMNLLFRCDELQNFFGWGEKFFISYRIRIYQLSESTFTKIQLSQQFALQWAFLYHSLSPVNSSLYREFPKKDAQQFKSPMSREEEQRAVQISIYEQKRKLHSANLKKW